MNLGSAVLWLAFASTVTSAGAYLLLALVQARATTGRRKAKHEGDPGPARAAFLVSLIMLASAAAQLLIVILRHDFAYSYVASYTSRDLPLLYLVSSFWAGQEGTFLLWAVMVALIGVFVIQTAGDYEAPVMFFTCLVNTALTSLMLVRSPFAPVDGPPPADGQGLNPLLQNPWMAVHPPTLFLGFAATTIPFAYAMSALWRREYTLWARRVTPWAALAFAALGAGISLGGYWAYKVLGWGGFWGWDPVENSSLVPWLTSTAALHALLLVRTNGTWQRSAILLCIATFLLAFYSTFLTRSGVLSNFSVHSFTDMGLNSHLIGWLLLFVVVSVGMFLLRLGSIPRGRRDTADYQTGALSLESVMYWGMVVLALLAGVVLLGTSAPIITGALAAVGREAPALAKWLPQEASSVGTSYYARSSTVLAIPLLVFIASVPVLSWRRTGMRQVLRRSRIPIAVGVFSAFASVLAGVTHPAMLAVIVLSATALTANAATLARAKSKGYRLGGYLTHAGVGILLIGAVASTVYSKSAKLVLPLDEPVSAGRYMLTYQGMDVPHDGRKPALRVAVKDSGGRVFVAAPPVFTNKRGEYMTEPYVRKYPLYDLYISPSGPPQSSGEGKQVMLVQGQQETVAGYTMRFDKFVPGSMGGNTVRVGVEVTVSRGGRTERLTPTMVVDMSGGRDTIPASTQDGGLRLSVLGISVDDKAVMLGVEGKAVAPGARETASVEVSTKPLINFVWLGSVLVILGGLLTVYRRARELGQWEARAAQTVPAPLAKAKPLIRSSTRQ
ncbi:MAG: cytochrome c biogenesis protein CcsA [Armatimonadota bacterium]